ncbi:ABC transporter permease [Peptoniphilus catoniae]|uniref:ABC transporter permease n=1 Tax=Peptoniphilus catoniae TaxID=1660341 RepID=UPI0010FDB2B0|nr:iron export ABC transporter permease subunit FetB [Peptoniphilus catoniae]
MNSDGTVNLSLFQMALAYAFILVMLFLVKKREIPREKDILIGSIRMTVQMTIMAYVLDYLFNNNSPFIPFIIIILMNLFSINNVFKRAKIKLPDKLKKTIVAAMFFGSTVTVFYFLLVVMQVKPWYESRYFIPVAGIITGNAMTGVSLAVNNLTDGMYDNRRKIESSLMLGATPKVATKEVVDGAFDLAILPSINSMMGMGIVFLPGMMTGQILAGMSPTTAIKYQVAIMLGLAGAVSLSTIILVSFGYKAFFNEEDQFLNLK